MNRSLLPGVVSYRHGYRVRVTHEGRTIIVDCRTYSEALWHLKDLRNMIHGQVVSRIDKEMAAT